jgi:acylpyruvate hydrolase
MDHGQEFRCHWAFGPWLVTPDAVPSGADALRIQSRLNGRVMQDARTDLLIFSVPELSSKWRSSGSVS